jgi:Tol biopolymer transport system component
VTTVTPSIGGGTGGVRRAIPIAAAAVLAGAIAGAGAMWFARRAGPDLDLQTRRFTSLAADSTDEARPTWSPDGRSLAYFSSVGPVSSLLVKDLDASSPVTLVGNLRRARDIFWWPDGNRVGFVDSRGAWLVSRAGGDPEQLQAGNFPTVSLSPDGRTLALWKVTTTASASTTALWLASPPNGTPVKYPRAFTESGLTSPIYVRYAPDGSRLLLSGFLADPANPTDQPPGVWEITGSSIDTMGPPRRVFASVRWVPPALGWFPDSRRVVLTNEGEPGLWLGDTNLDTVRKITDGLGGEYEPSVSPDGRRIAFESRHDNYDTIEIPLDGSPIVDVLAASPAEVGASRTRDGRIVYVSNASGPHEIRVRATDGSDRAVVTLRDFPGEPDAGHALLSPTVSPDGQRLLFARFRQAGMGVWIAPLSGATPVLATPEGGFAVMPDWSPDGRWIAFAAIGTGSHQLAKQRVGSSDPPQILASMLGASSALAWSPDGAWIAHDDTEGVSIIAPEGGTDRVLAPKLRPRAIAWSADARTLYGLVVDDEGSRIVAINVASGAVRIVRPLPAELEFTTPVTPGLRMTVNANGTRLLTTVLRARSDIWMMEGFEADPR